MRKKEKININIFYNENGVNILDFFESDFNEFLEQYLKENIL